MYSEQNQCDIINFAVNVVTTPIITALLITFIALSEYNWIAFTFNTKCVTHTSHSNWTESRWPSEYLYSSNFTGKFNAVTEAVGRQFLQNLLRKIEKKQTKES
jgi:hypothetical protein